MCVCACVCVCVCVRVCVYVHVCKHMCVYILARGIADLWLKNSKVLANQVYNRLFEHVGKIFTRMQNIRANMLLTPTATKVIVKVNLHKSVKLS